VIRRVPRVICGVFTANFVSSFNSRAFPRIHLEPFDPLFASSFSSLSPVCPSCDFERALKAGTVADPYLDFLFRLKRKSRKSPDLRPPSCPRSNVIFPDSAESPEDSIRSSPRIPQS